MALPPTKLQMENIVKKTLLVKTLLMALVASTLPTAAQAEAWKVDTVHSSVTFEIRHFFSNTTGRFTGITGDINYDVKNPAASTVEITIQATSINTDSTDRDGHLRSPDFFDVAQFPTATFKSTSVTAKDAKTLSVTGDLTIKGKTKRTTIEVQVLGVMELGGGKAKAGFSSEFTVDRKEFGVTWNKTLDQGGTVLGDDVKVRVQIEADRKV